MVSLRPALARAKRSAKRMLAPISQATLRGAIDEVTGGGCDILYVHSGLSSLGHVLGGPDGAIEILQDVCETLFLPTHTYCYPDEAGAPGPVYDRALTRSEMGLLAETFWRSPGVLRSIHSTHSLAAKGPLAGEILADHYEAETPCGDGTPYSRLVHRRGAALMLGVSFRYYTPFHTAECEAGSAVALEPPEVMDRLRFVDEAGQVQERTRRRQNRFNSRFHEAGDLLEQKGLVRSRPLGRSALLFAPDMAKVHDFLLERLAATPDFLRAECNSELA